MTYVERLRPPILWWFVVAALALTFVIAVAVFLTIGYVIATAVVSVVVLVGLMLAFSGRTEVSADGLRTARATLAWPYVGSATPLTKAEVRERLGPGADTRAFVMYRSYVDEAVEVTVDDTADPHPYWIVSTRDAARLVAQIETGRQPT